MKHLDVPIELNHRKVPTDHQSAQTALILQPPT
jgi:hypothetical protein